MDILGYGAMGLGGLIAIIGWIWLIIIGFKEGGALWGILNIFFQPITGLIFCIMHKTGWLQLALLIIGNVIAGLGAVPVMMSVMDQVQKAPGL